MRRWGAVASSVLGVIADRPHLWLPGALAWLATIGWIPLVVTLVQPPTAGELVPGTDVTVAVDQVLIEDATGTMCAMQFELLGSDEVQVPLAVMYVDHNVLQIDDKNMQGTLKNLPERDEILPDINENLVVELYSK